MRIASDLVGMEGGQQQGSAHAVPPEFEQQNIEERTLSDRKQGLGRLCRQGPQPGPESAAKDHGLARWILRRADEHHEASPARPRDLAAEGAGRARRGIEAVNVRVADVAGRSLLRLPRAIQDFRHAHYVAAEQGLFHVQRVDLQSVQSLQSPLRARPQRAAWRRVPIAGNG